MTENEKKLLTLIRESENHEQALLKAVDIILAVLKQPVSSEVLNPAYPQEDD